MRSRSTIGFGRVTLGVAIGALALSACSKPEADDDADTAEVAPANTEVAVAPATETPAPATGAPAADNTDTLTGVKYASYTGDVEKGKIAFLQCQTCHSVDAGVNKIGPSLHAIVGRKASTVAGFAYSKANHDSGITWTEDKLFQYLEKPQRVVPGTKMTFAGYSDPQKRADTIAYLKTLG